MAWTSTASHLQDYTVGGGAVTPRRSNYTRYYDAAENSTTGFSDFGLTPTPKSRTHSAGASYRRGAGDYTTPRPKLYTSHIDEPVAPWRENSAPVRRDLTSELSASRERSGYRGNLAALHPSFATGRESALDRDRAGLSVGRQPSPEPSSPSRRRPPSMIKDPYASFLPRREHLHAMKPVVVLDLDETLVYAREGPVNVRPGTRELLGVLDGAAEVVVWTAGEREYAQSVISRIDPRQVIHHCVYRHPKWWSGKPGYSKNLTSLGRPVERTLLIDNTPDCLKDHPWNSILVTDYVGQSDEELFDVARVLQRVVDAPLDETVPSILSRCPELIRRRVPLDTYGAIEVWTLRNSSTDFSPSRVNRDLHKAATVYRLSRW